MLRVCLPVCLGHVSVHLPRVKEYGELVAEGLKDFAGVVLRGKDRGDLTQVTARAVSTVQDLRLKRQQVVLAFLIESTAQGKQHGFRVMCV